MYVHLGNQCLIWNEKKSCWSMAIILLLSDLAASNRDGKFYHAPLTTKFTKQTEGLPWGQRVIRLYPLVTLPVNSMCCLKLLWEPGSSWGKSSFSWMSSLISYTTTFRVNKKFTCRHPSSAKSNINIKMEYNDIKLCNLIMVLN